MIAPTRPVLRYHGGKWRLAPWIISHFPPHRVYVEPFGGAASVLVRKPRSHAEVYNDLDGEVVNVFRVLRDEPAAARLASMLVKTPFSRAEYYEAHEPCEDRVERARRTMVKAWMGFGSGALIECSAGFRVALSGRRHTPREWARFPEQVPAFCERLAGVLIENLPAPEIIARYDAPDALFYVDPPYVHDTRGRRHRYRVEMTANEHIALAAQLRGAKGAVVLSGYASPMYRDLYDGWRAVEHAARDAQAQMRTETLWINRSAA